VNHRRSDSVIGPLFFALLVLRLAGCASDPKPGGSPSAAPVPLVQRQPEPVPAVVAASGSAAGTTVVLPPAPPEPPPPSMPVTRLLETGEGWRRIKVGGEAEDPNTGEVRRLRDEYYVIDDRAAILRTSLPTRTQRALALSLGPPPSDGDDEVIIVSTLAIAAVEGMAVAQSECRDTEKVFAKTHPIDRTYNVHKTSDGAFAGSADLKARINGSVTTTIKYSVRHTSCLPYLVIRRIDLAGNTDVVASAAVDATFEGSLDWGQEVYAPVLGSVILPGGGAVPITIKAPISVGIDATAAAQLRSSGSFEAHGRFAVRCNRGGCAGSRSATHGFVPGGTPSATVAGRAQVTPWAEGGVRASVIDESVLRAQVGVRARLATDLWGASGDRCGDADHDGSNETVTATTIDLGIGVDVVAKESFLGRDEAPWFWNVWNRHLAFWSVGGEAALSPMFYVQGVQKNGAITVRAGMRPCWPYADVVTYLVTWGDGSTNLINGAPGTLLTLAHTFGSLEPHGLRLDALSDADGRTLGGSTERSLIFPGHEPPPAVVRGRPRGGARKGSHAAAAPSGLATLP
jgi:hypothetical protein